MILDLTFNTQINQKFKKRFEKIIRDSVDDFHKIVDDISKKNLNNIDWWVSSVSSRNTLHSPFFYYFSSINFLLSLNDKDKQNISLIYTDNIHMLKIYRYILSDKNINIKLKKNFLLKRIFIFIKNYLELYRQIFYRFIQYLLTNFIFYKTYNFYSKNINIIDKYYFPEFLDKERYYNGIFDFLSKKQIQNTYFVSTIVMFKTHKLPYVYKKLIKKNNLIIKEHFLNYRDYFFALMYYKRIKLININNINYKKIDLTNLIRYELSQTNLSLFASVEAILNYRFFYNLKLLKIKINTSLDWFENQIVDRGWNLGLNRNYKQAKSFGYLGFIPKDMLLSEMYVTETEYKAEVIPKKLFVIGKNLIKDRKKFCKKYEVDVAPAFRFQNLFKVKHKKNTKKSICIILPVILEDSFELLDTFEKINTSIINKKINIFIKPHPTLNKIMKEKLHSLNFKYSIINDNIYNYIVSSSLVITGGSSICMETISLGVPLAIIKFKRNFQFIPIPSDVDSSLWSLCETKEDLLSFINRSLNSNFQNDKKRIYNSKVIMNKYFEKPTYNSVKKIIN